MDNNLRNNILWEYLSRSFGIIVTLIVSIILARILGPLDYGIVGISMAINGIAGVFLNLGFGSSIVQSNSTNNLTLSTIFYLNLLISIIIFILIVIVSPLVQGYYKIENLSNVINFSAFGFVLSAIGTVHNSLLIKKLSFKKLSLANLISSVLSGVVGVYFSYTIGVWGLVIQQLFSIVILNIFYWSLCDWRPKLIFNIKSIHNEMKFGSYMFLTGFIDGIYTRFDIFFIAKLFSPETLGLYSRSTGFDGLIRNLTSGSILGVLFPTFIKHKNDKEQLTIWYYEYFGLICFVFCFFSGMFFLSAENIFIVLFGYKWIISSHYYKIIAVGGFCFPLSSLCIAIIESRGNSKMFFFSESIKKVVQLPIYIVAIYYNIYYFLIGLTFFSVVNTFISIFFLKLEIGVSLKKSFSILSNYILLTTLIIIIVELTRIILGYQNSLIYNSLEVVLYFISYLTVNFLVKSKALETFKVIFGFKKNENANFDN